MSFSRQCLPLALIALAAAASAQEALRNSLAGDAAAEARRTRQQNLPFTFKAGDFKVLVSPSLEQRWNDNVNVSSSGGRQQDFIVAPMVQLDLSYPVTAHNLLQFNVGLGYDAYLEHSEYSGVRIFSGSALSFDTYIKDFWINFHDRFSFTQDSAGQAAVAGSGRYGGFENTAGLAVTWDLRDVVLTLGYDHQNFLSSAGQFERLNRASELLVARAGFRFHPRLLAGVEATGSFTTYEQRVLNDNQAYSTGLYADWRPGSHSRVQLRGGYTVYYFDQTSALTRAVDQHGWYADLTASQAITDAIALALSAGHELRLGVYSDTTEAWYVRPNLTWRLIQDLTLNAFVSYEHGKQGLALAGGASENYDWVGTGLGASYAITKKLTASLSYRLTLRYSDALQRNYTQNIVALRLTYQFK